MDGVVDDLARAIRRNVLLRRIEVDAEAATAALSGLTHEQGREIEARWLERDHHKLAWLLQGDDDTFPATSLRQDQVKELFNLLGGTRADVAGGEPALAAAQERALVVEAARLHNALRRGPSGNEAAFAIDDFVKSSVLRDPDLAEVIHAPDFIPEPDFIDSILPDWFDVTPRRQWVAHLLRYGETHGNQPDQAHLLPTDRR